MKFTVTRPHMGDKFYDIGDEREAKEAEVSHLIGSCLEKMEAASKNKAAPKVKNKAK